MSDTKNKPSLLQSLWNFVKKPVYIQAIEKREFFQTIKDILKFWSLGLFVAVITTYFSGFFTGSLGIDDTQNLLENFFKENSIWIIVFIVFLWGPITEELTFRLVLRYSPLRFGFFLSFVLFLFFELIISLFNEFENMVSLWIDKIGVFSFLFIILLLEIFIGLIISRFLYNSQLSKKIEGIIINYFPYLFYGSTLLFGVVHIFNFANFKDIWIFLPFFVAPQILLGFILSYIRVNYGLQWSIFYHFIHNALASLPILFFTQISQESLDLISEASKNEDFILKDAEKIYFAFGTGSAILVFLVFLISFYYLIKNHFRYLKNK